MTTSFPEQLWKTSSYSGTGGGQCVEAAIAETAVGLRDSKDRGGGQLTFRRSAFTAFVTAVRSGTFD